MPEIGDIIMDNHRSKLIWHACVNCGKGRWVQYRKGNPNNIRCVSCTQRMHYGLPKLPDDKYVPKIGDIQIYKRQRCIWQACEVCGKERWVRIRKGIPIGLKCSKCSRYHLSPEHGKFWIGSKYQTNGYMFLRLHPNNNYYPMVDNRGYVLEHRYVMAIHLGRCLLKSESVHHKNGIKTDNRFENLQLVSIVDHSIRNMLCNPCGLRKEIRLLKQQIKQKDEQIGNLTGKLMGLI